MFINILLPQTDLNLFYCNHNHHIYIYIYNSVICKPITKFKPFTYRIHKRVTLAMSVTFQLS